MDIFLEDYEADEIKNGKKCFTAPVKEINEKVNLIKESTGDIIKKLGLKDIEQYKLDYIENLDLPILVFDGMIYDEYKKNVELKKECTKQKFIASYNGGFTIWKKNHIVCWINR